MEHPDDLRKLKAWCRRMTEIGHSDESGWRQRFAEYLERRATEIEMTRGRSSVHAAHT